MISESTAVEHITAGMELLPSQLARHKATTQEERFWMEYLNRNVADHQTYLAAYREAPDDARIKFRLRETTEWFADTRVEPCSFEWCCEIFDIVPDEMRKALGGILIKRRNPVIGFPRSCEPLRYERKNA